MSSDRNLVRRHAMENKLVNSILGLSDLDFVAVLNRLFYPDKYCVTEIEGVLERSEYIDDSDSSS